MSIEDAVSRDPERMSGALCFKGDRVLVSTLFDYLADGQTVSEFERDFPGLPAGAIEAVLRNALATLEERFASPLAA